MIRSERYWNEEHDMCILTQRIEQITVIKIESYPEDKGNDPDAMMTISIPNELANKLGEFLIMASERFGLPFPKL